MISPTPEQKDDGRFVARGQPVTIPSTGSTAPTDTKGPTLMTLAEALVWNIHIARLETIVSTQREQFARGDLATPTILCPPTSKHVEIAQSALDRMAADTRESIIGLALQPLIDAIDAIDNSHSKSETVKACRVEIQKAYEQLHTLRESATSSDAVDPQDGTTPA